MLLHMLSLAIAINLIASSICQEDQHRNLRKSCLYEAPYLYVTTHDEVPNVLKYTRDGCLVTDEVLIGGPADDEDHITEFRSMAIGRYKDQKQALYIADAMSRESYLLVYSECDANGQRHYLDTVVSTEQNEGADHAYGICFDQDGNIYASFQHTDCVLRFSKDSFKPMPFPISIRFNRKWKEYYDGTFVQFGTPGLHPGDEQGVRGIVIVGDNMWVANEDIGGVAVVDMATGMVNNIVVVHNPIGLHYDTISGLIFVGSKRKHWRGAVYAIDPSQYRIVARYSTERMNHPAGITSHGDVLYVGEQVRADILMFSISTQKYLGTLVADGPGEIEQLIMSSC